MGNCIPVEQHLNNQVGTADGKMRKSRKGTSAGTKERYAIMDGKYDVKLPYEKKCTIVCCIFAYRGCSSRRQ
ncbi:hypothetical protein DPMN_020394 [Dreissena polymorpha]|uniref:Uncharacterized protein n=1 Tax=Dreissena polymorpha TaxID=45954 RepID=A0A9D4S914_DREPO|nr:hypothetical protein DPMN_020394 [Dreissena polymorpha]